MCCADTTGCQRVDVAASSSFDNAASPLRGRSRLLRRVIDAFRPSPRRDQIAQQPGGNFLKEKFASPQMEMDPLIDSPASCSNQDTTNTKAWPTFDSQTSLLAVPASPEGSRTQSPRNLPTGQGPYKQLRSMSSMSTQSEVGERVREARSEQCVTRRPSYCSAREGVEEEREPLEPEGNFCNEATE